MSNNFGSLLNLNPSMQATPLSGAFGNITPGQIPANQFSGSTMPSSLGVDMSLTPQAPDRGSVLGMPTDNFSAMAGGIASAISKPTSWQGRLGNLAQGLGAVQMQKMAAEQQLKGNMNMLSEMAKKDPEFAKQLMTRFAAEGTPVPPVSTTTTTGQTGGI